MISNKQLLQAFEKSTLKTHVITSWIGLGLNLIWFLSDMIVFPELAIPFFKLRCVVSLSAALLLIVRRKLSISIEWCMFYLIAGIAIQNAYMWSVMDIHMFQQHTFAYVALFIGAGMLVLWNWHYSIGIFVISLLSNAFFFWMNSRLSLQELGSNGGLLVATVMVFCGFLIRTRYRLTWSEFQLRWNLEASKQLIAKQKDDVELKNKEITDSIHYAKTIQQALLPTDEQLQVCFNASAVLYLPKSIVSGDFYWVHRTESHTFLVVGDCTGHGVPGGFMTMLGLSFLEELVGTQAYTNPAEILDKLRAKIIVSLNQNGAIGESKDGMDLSICVIHHDQQLLTMAAANNSVYVLRNGSVIQLEAMRQPCGYSPVARPFENQSIQLQKGDRVVCATDGYTDQFGGPKGKKYRLKSLLQSIVEMESLPINVVKEQLLQQFFSWRGDLEQVDDVLVFLFDV